MGLEYVIKPNYGEFVDETDGTGKDWTTIKLSGGSNLRGINVIIRTTLCTDDDDDISNTSIHIRLLGMYPSNKVGFQYVDPAGNAIQSTLVTAIRAINLTIILTPDQIVKLNSGGALMLHVSVRKGVNPDDFTITNDIMDFNADMSVLSSSPTVMNGAEIELVTCNRDYRLGVE